MLDSCIVSKFPVRAAFCQYLTGGNYSSWGDKQDEALYFGGGRWILNQYWVLK
jgi:hypothetical protein